MSKMKQSKRKTRLYIVNTIHKLNKFIYYEYKKIENLIIIMFDRKEVVML